MLSKKYSFECKDIRFKSSLLSDFMIRMLSNLNRSIKHKLNDEFEYKQFVTVLTNCFVFWQGLSIP